MKRLWWLRSRSVHSPQPIRIGQAELDPLRMRQDSTRPAYAVERSLCNWTLNGNTWIHLLGLQVSFSPIPNVVVA